MADPVLERNLFRIPPSGNTDAYGQPIGQPSKTSEADTTGTTDPILDDIKNWMDELWTDVKNMDISINTAYDEDWQSKPKPSPREREEFDPEQVAAPKRPVYTPPPTPPALTREQRIQQMVGDDLGVGKLKRYQPDASGSAGIQAILNNRPSIEDYQQKDYYKDIKAGEGYGTWDYIRDMSAGLLASDDNTFLGAMGDAALLSNKNRAAMDSQQKDLANRIALAKAKGAQTWDMARYKADSTLAGKLAGEMGGSKVKLGKSVAEVEDETGKKHSLVQVTEGADVLTAKGSEVFDYNGIPVVYQKTADHWKQNERIHQRHSELLPKMTTFMGNEDQYGKALRNELRKHMHKGNLVLGVTQSDEYRDYLSQLSDTQKDALDEVTNAIDEGRGGDALSFMQTAQMAPGLMAGLKKSMEEGLYSSLTTGEQGRLNELIEGRASELAYAAIEEDTIAGKPKGHNPAQFVRQALREIVPNINWDIDGEGKFRINISETEYGQELNRAGDIVGQDLEDALFNFDWLDTSESPYEGEVDDPRTDTILQLKNEIDMFNKNQYSLLSEYNKGVLHADNTEAADKIAKASGIDRTAAINDLWSEIIQHDVVSGGEDLPGSVNIESKYRPLNTWKVEPGNLRQQARDMGYLWDSKRGLWYKPGGTDIRRPKIKVDEIKLK